MAGTLNIVSGQLVEAATPTKVLTIASGQCVEALAPQTKSLQANAGGQVAEVAIASASLSVGAIATPASGNDAATTTGVTTAALGSTFVVGITGGVPLLTLVDNKGNTYTNISGAINGLTTATGNAQVDSVWVCENGLGGAGHTWTATWNAAIGHAFGSVFPIELKSSVLANYPTLDVQSHVADSTTPYVAPNVTTTQANDLLLAFIGDACNASSVTHTPSGTGLTYTKRSEVTASSSWYTGCIATAPAATAASWPSQWTATQTVDTVCFLLAFKPH